MTVVRHEGAGRRKERRIDAINSLQQVPLWTAKVPGVTRFLFWTAVVLAGLLGIVLLIDADVFTPEALLFPAIGAVVVIFPIALVWLIIWGLMKEPGPVEWPDALIGVATVTEILSITELKDGRRLINMNVSVEPAHGGPPFNATFSRRVPQKSVPGVQPGLQFPAMYRPDRPEKVKIARATKQEPAQQFFDHVRMRDGTVRAEELRADREGVLTEADVLNIVPTVQTRGGFPVYDVDLRVEVVGEAPLEVRKSMPLSSYEHGLLAASPRVRVKYLVENPRAVAVGIEDRQEELQ